MAKITYYPKVTKLEDEDVFMIDGADGTRTVETKDLVKELQNRLDMDVYEYLDNIGIPLGLRKNIFRGSKIATLYPDDAIEDWVFDEISNGTFKGLWLGDYWEQLYDNEEGGLSSRIWRIVDFDHWLNIGFNYFAKEHHLVIMPDEPLFYSPINSTNTTEGGYVGSDVFNKVIKTNKITNMVKAFTGTHLLLHYDYFSNAVTDGVVSGGIWAQTYIDLPTEMEMCGTSREKSVASKVYNHKGQLSLMKNSDFTGIPRGTMWLRDVSSSEEFYAIGGHGGCYSKLVSASLGIRPLFGIY